MIWISPSDDPYKDADRRDIEEERARNRRSIGECVQCYQPILARDEGYEGEEYVETEDGLVHWECWDAYGRDKKQEAL